MTDQEYRYFGTMVGIVDGDTFDIDADLGFSTRRKERFRLLGSKGGVNTPEMNSRDPAERVAAIAAKARAAELVPIGSQVLIMTKMDKQDGFRRYLAQIVILAGASAGANLGDTLLAEGHAKIWIG